MGFKAVRIIHNIVTRIDFCFLAEFFRFAGIYVVECIEGDEDESPYQNSPGCYDVTIATCASARAAEGKCIDFDKIKKIYEKKDVSIGEDESLERFYSEQNSIIKGKNIHQWDEMLQKAVLENVLTEICGVFEIPDLCTGWSPIINAYVDNMLTIHSMDLQYFIKKPSFAVEEAQKAFYMAYKMINEPECEIGIKNLDYARLYSMVKVNTACKFMKQEYRFPIKELAKECEQCIDKYPDFSNMKVLLGLCYEYEPRYAPWAIQAFEIALKTENMYCYSSHIFYWLGKQCERYKEKQSKIAEYYVKSYQRKRKYKNIYKLAIIERGKGNYKEAISFFQGIVDKLKPKFESEFADPLEIVYLFKSYAMIAIIYFNDLKNYFWAMEYGEFLISSYNTFTEGSNFFTAFYGEKAEKYIELTKSRFELDRVSSILYYSYQYLGFDEKQKNFLK